MKVKKCIYPFVAVLFAQPAVAGIFAPAAGSPGSTAVPADDPGIESWATGFENYQPGVNVDAAFQTPQKATGEAGDSDGTAQGYVFDIVSLGTGGSITLKFNPPIVNGDGYDFAIYENGFSDTFLELAKVEVSTNGTDFVPFPAFSLIPAPVGGFGAMDPTDLEQVAGKYRGGYGTPFDLDQLAGSSVLNMSRIRYVRLKDIVGDGSAVNDLSVASLTHWLGATPPQSVIDLVSAAPAAVYDPFPTAGSAGFDLDAVAVMNAGAKQIDMDIAVFDSSNEINPDSTGVVSVAILTTRLAEGDELDFTASDVKNASLTFGPDDAQYAAGPFTFDADGDGDNDRGWQFNIQDTGIACGDTWARLDGETKTGEAFWGRDTISTVDCDDGCHP